MPSREAFALYTRDLKDSGFQGDIESSYAERIVASTDNSIYQLTPRAILYPRVEDDIKRVMKVLSRHRDKALSVCARGGGTGTNGQSLGDNLILDCSRHLNNIIDFAPDKLSVTVQPGVVLDQLNDYLEPHALFFPIDISSSSRATLGGMVATDASGKGSLIYGKTSKHIQSLDLVLADGTELQVQNTPRDQLKNDSSGLLPAIYRLVDGQRTEIDRVFPDMNRGLTGYNLQQCISQEHHFNPCFLIAGSEGTLALIRRITLAVLPRPTHRMLTVIFYDNFLRGLDHVQPLLESQPAAIEMLDDKILTLARKDSIWFDVQSVLDGLPEHREIKAANFVEHLGYSEQELEQSKNKIDNILQQTRSDYRVILSKTETDKRRISALWNLRKKAVGLLGQSQDGKRAVAFVEDTAVPPQNLVAYVTGFKKILDDHQLDYGMYGHADAGVLHVRPTLNLLQRNDRKLIRRISDSVAQLARQQGGVLWGEHGRGFRGEYSELFFGEKLYPVLCDIKKKFDPYNLLNPGKLTTPDVNKPVIALDDITLRGELDAQIDNQEQHAYADTLSCNGNGACYNWQPGEAMCPSYKATRNKLYSPKGRAAMLREWLRLKNTTPTSTELNELENSLYNSLQHCLSCKSCTSSCPLKVDIPELKSRFLANWFQRKPRPFSAIFTRHFETLIAIARQFPDTSNRIIQNRYGENLLRHFSGLNRLPKFTRQDYTKAILITDQNINQLKTEDNAVILLRDNYMQSFDQPTLQACCDVLTHLGYRVYLSDIIHNGKLLHVKGYRKEFSTQAEKVLARVRQLSKTGLPLISTETVTRLLFEQEYPAILQLQNSIKIHSIESFLAANFEPGDNRPVIDDSQPVVLLPHCMEQTSVRESSQHWQTVFQRLGIHIRVINAGCCGMSGLFGHEVDNNKLSDDIYKLAWEPTLNKPQRIFLASGFSCRCQCKNHGHAVIHPILHLAQLLPE